MLQACRPGRAAHPVERIVLETARVRLRRWLSGSLPLGGSDMTTQLLDAAWLRRAPLTSDPTDSPSLHKDMFCGTSAYPAPCVSAGIRLRSTRLGEHGRARAPDRVRRALPVTAVSCSGGVCCGIPHHVRRKGSCVPCSVFLRSTGAMLLVQVSG